MYYHRKSYRCTYKCGSWYHLATLKIAETLLSTNSHSNQRALKCKLLHWLLAKHCFYYHSQTTKMYLFSLFFCCRLHFSSAHILFTLRRKYGKKYCVKRLAKDKFHIFSSHLYLICHDGISRRRCLWTDLTRKYIFIGEF